jgi:hypothetical protein
LLGASIGTYSDVHALLGDSLQASHYVLLHLDKLRQLLGQIGAEGTAGIAAKRMACIRVVSWAISCPKD